jgi:phosphotransacetylase
MFKSFKEIAKIVSDIEEKTVIAVVEAHDEHTIESVVEATRDKLISPLLIGNADKIAGLLRGLNAKAVDFNVIGTESTDESLAIAVKKITDREAGAVMKGKLETGAFMKAILKKENNLIKGGRLSLIGFYEMPQYHKLFSVSDVGLNTYPDLAGKKDILTNAVGALHALGVENPKVAVLTAVEKVDPKMPDTVDAAALKKMNVDGEISGCVVEGPISFDLAMFKEAARIKGYESPVAGDADFLLAPDIVSGNVLVKCLTGFAGATTAGMVVGAKVPVVLTSRSAEASDKYFSIAFAAYSAAHFQEGLS